MKFIDVMIIGGVMMWPILFCSIVSLAVFIDRFWFFSKSVHADTDGLLCEVVAKVKQGDVAGALSLASARETPLHAVMKAIVGLSGSSKTFIKEKAQEVSLYEVPKMERNLNYLASVAQVAPLMGLLGTVFGLIQCFSAIELNAGATGAVNPADLAGGIKQALYTTAFGLVVAIPAYLIYNYFVNKVNRYVTEMERCATELVLVMEKQGLTLE